MSVLSPLKWLTARIKWYRVQKSYSLNYDSLEKLRGLKQDQKNKF